MVLKRYIHSRHRRGAECKSPVSTECAGFDRVGAGSGAGNIIRLCANSGAKLHLIKPLGFTLEDSKLRRAGLDYWEFASVQVYETMDRFMREVKPHRLFACSKYGQRAYHKVAFQTGDALLFGSETDGLPAQIRDSIPTDRLLRIPMLPDNRSLNLSNAVAVVLYEAWRQNEFKGGL